MPNLHAFIVIPYYFFGALALLSAFVVITRVLRIETPIHYLVSIAIGLSLSALVIPLLLDIFDTSDLHAKPMLALGLSSFVLAAIDSLLMTKLPLPLDEELHHE